jgi:hypothetical protein
MKTKTPDPLVPLMVRIPSSVRTKLRVLSAQRGVPIRLLVLAALEEQRKEGPR